MYTDRQTDRKMLTVNFRDCTNVPKNVSDATICEVEGTLRANSCKSLDDVR
jgi:hypothetical protein